MAVYTEEVEEGLTIDHEGAMSIKRVTVTKKDGVEVGRSMPWRVATVPGDDVSQLSSLVQAVAAAVWTPQVKKFWKDRRDKAIADLPKA